MNLAEIYLTTKDLNILQGARLDAVKIYDKYQNHNTFDLARILPVVESDLSYFDFRPRVIKMGRWGRHILVSFSTCTILFKMTAHTKIIVGRGSSPQNSLEDAACLLTFMTDNGPFYFIYTDPLCCGYVSIYSVGVVPTEFSSLGLDILDSVFTGNYLMTEAMNRALTTQVCTVKEFIMDTSVIAWLDNDVASEVLFLSGIHPQLNITTELSMFKANYLVRSMVMLYYRMIECLQNDICSVVKSKPEDVFSIYGHDGGECCICDTRIQKLVIAGFDTYVCSKCQPLPTKKVNA